MSKPEILDLFDEYATDESLENNGTWFPIGKGAQLLIARAGNKQYAKELTGQVERNQAVLDLEDDAAEAKSNEIMIDVLAKTVLLGWKNLAYKGKPMDYSIDNAKTVLAHLDFRRKVVKLSDDINAYRAKLEVEQGEA